MESGKVEDVIGILNSVYTERETVKLMAEEKAIGFSEILLYLAGFTGFLIACCSMGEKLRNKLRK